MWEEESRGRRIVRERKNDKSYQSFLPPTRKHFELQRESEALAHAWVQLKGMTKGWGE